MTSEKVKLMPRLGFLEIFLMQFIVYGLLWLFNDYIATLMSITFAAISLFILLISLVAELIEPSRVPRWYFTLMLASILAPILASATYLYITGGYVEWMQG